MIVHNIHQQNNDNKQRPNRYNSALAYQLSTVLSASDTHTGVSITLTFLLQIERRQTISRHGTKIKTKYLHKFKQLLSPSNTQ